MILELKDLIKFCMARQVAERVLNDNINPAGKELSTILIRHVRYDGDIDVLSEGIDDLITRSVKAIIKQFKELSLNFDAKEMSKCKWCHKPFDDYDEDAPVYYRGAFYHASCKDKVFSYFKQYEYAKRGMYQGD